MSRGKPIFLDYDQAALDAAYDQSAYAANREQLIKRRIRDSELAGRRVGEPQRVAYGPTEIERLDIYRSGSVAAPVFVFIHGGAWRSGRSKEFATPAEMFLTAGAHYIYSAAAGSFMPESAARIQEMAPTRAAADKLYDERVARIAKGDANDSLWAIESIEDYSPEGDLPKIKAKVLLINTVEDVANPPELGTVERAMKAIHEGRYVVIPYSDKTHGHFTHYYAAVWKPYLISFMGTLGPTAAAR